MGRTMQVYTSGSTATSTTVTQLQTELDHVFAWLRVTESDPYVSEQLAAEILEALAAAERGETEDLGSFAQYADETDDED